MAAQELLQLRTQQDLQDPSGSPSGPHRTRRQQSQAQQRTPRAFMQQHSSVQQIIPGADPYPGGTGVSFVASNAQRATKQVVVSLPSAQGRNNPAVSVVQSAAAHGPTAHRVPNLDGNLTDEDSDDNEEEGGGSQKKQQQQQQQQQQQGKRKTTDSSKAKSTVDGSLSEGPREAAISILTSTSTHQKKAMSVPTSHSIKSLLGVSDDEDDDGNVKDNRQEQNEKPESPKVVAQSCGLSVPAASDPVPASQDGRGGGSGDASEATSENDEKIAVTRTSEKPLELTVKKVLDPEDTEKADETAAAKRPSPLSEAEAVDLSRRHSSQSAETSRAEVNVVLNLSTKVESEKNVWKESANSLVDLPSSCNQSHPAAAATAAGPAAAAAGPSSDVPAPPPQSPVAADCAAGAGQRHSSPTPVSFPSPSSSSKADVNVPCVSAPVQPTPKEEERSKTSSSQNDEDEEECEEDSSLPLTETTSAPLLPVSLPSSSSVAAVAQPPPSSPSMAPHTAAAAAAAAAASPVTCLNVCDTNLREMDSDSLKASSSSSSATAPPASSLSKPSSSLTAASASPPTEVDLLRKDEGKEDGDKEATFDDEKSSSQSDETSGRQKEVSYVTCTFFLP